MPPLFLSKTTRTKLHLSEQKLLKRSSDDKRQTLSVFVKLSDGNALVGMPEWVQNAYTQMVKIANKSKHQVFDTVIPGCFVECFGTEKTKSKLFAIINAATLSHFVMDRTGKDDTDVEVNLSFKITFAGRKEIYDWYWDAKKETFFAQFEESQQDLTFAQARDNESDEVEQDGDLEDEDDEDDDAEQDELPLDDDDDDDDEEDDDEDEEDEGPSAAAKAQESVAEAAKAANDSKRVNAARRNLTVM